MSIFSGLFGKPETGEQIRERVARQLPEVVRMYQAGEPIEKIADKHGRTTKSIIVSLVRAGVFRSTDPSQRRKAIHDYLSTITELREAEKLLSIDGNSGIVIAGERDNVYIISNDGVQVHHRVVVPEKLYSAEIIEDGVSIAKSTGSTKVASAIVGGLLFGGVGAVVGGLAGDSKRVNSKLVNGLEIKILVNDTAAPTHSVVLLNSPTESGDASYKDAIVLAQHWIDRLVVVMRRASDGAQLELQGAKARATPTRNRRPKVKKPIEVVDELSKLADLYHAGLLSLEEFNTLKVKLLSDRMDEA